MESNPADLPLVSIITPSFNQGKFIKKTIESVLTQTYPNIELIVMDGGSTDETLEILKGYAGKIKYVSEKDNGQTDAINKGLKMASGRILGFLNSDDYLYPDAIQTIVSAFSNPAVLWVTGDYQIIDADENPIQYPIVSYKRFLRGFSSRTMIRLTNYIIQPGTFWRRELQQRIGEFDTSLRYVMDYDFWLRAFSVSKPRVIRQKLSAFRIHGESKGGRQFIDQFNEEITVLRRYCSNPVIIGIHIAHNLLIKSVYRLIK